MLIAIVAAFFLSGVARPLAPPQRMQPLSPRAVFLKDRADKPIPAAIVAEFLDDDAVRAAGGSRERAAFEVAKSLLAEPIDLDGDRTRDWVVRYGCAAVGNCGTYVYRATRGGFREVLEANDLQTVRTRWRSSHGLRDWEAGRHGSAFDGEMFVYRFDGREYRRVACLIYSYRYLDARGDAHMRRKPKLTREKCEAEEP